MEIMGCRLINYWGNVLILILILILVFLIPPLPDPLLLRSAGGLLETVEHVLFDCPALCSLRPISLRGCASRPLSHRRHALAHPDTVRFVRDALARVSSDVVSSSSASLTPTDSHLYRPPTTKVVPPSSTALVVEA